MDFYNSITDDLRFFLAEKKKKKNKKNQLF